MKWFLALMIPTFIFSNVSVLKKNNIKALTQKNIETSFDADSFSTMDKNNPFIIDQSIDFRNINHTFADFVYLYDGLYQIHSTAKLDFPAGLMTGCQIFFKDEKIGFFEPGVRSAASEIQTEIFIDGSLQSNKLESVKTSFVVRKDGQFYIGQKTEDKLCGSAVLDGSIMFNQSLLSAPQIKTTPNTKITFYKDNRLYADQLSYLEGNYYFSVSSKIYASDVSISNNDTLLEGKNIVFKNATLHIDVVFEADGCVSFPRLDQIDIDENVTIKFYFLQSYSEGEKRKIDFGKFIDALSKIESVELIEYSANHIKKMPKIMFLSNFDEYGIFMPYSDVVEELKKKSITLVIETKKNEKGHEALFLIAKKSC